MGLLPRRRLAALALGLALAALVSVSLSSAGRKEEKVLRTSGPVIALYVVDHYGESPTAEELAPYGQAFRRVLAGCSISPAELSSVVFHLSDRASMGSGTEIDNLAVLQGLVRHVGTTKQDCADEFVLTDARLQGAALD
jgi:hypothetical protein